MAEVLKGKNIVLFFRPLSKRETMDAARLRFQIDHTLSKSKNVESTTTKDGKINTVSDGDSTFDISSLAYREDTKTINIWKELEKYFDSEELMEVWQVDCTGVTPENLDVKPTYFQGLFTDFELSAPADGNAELSFSFAINGRGVEGSDKLTQTQLAAIQNGLYEYEKMSKTANTI